MCSQSQDSSGNNKTFHTHTHTWIQYRAAFNAITHTRTHTHIDRERLKGNDFGCVS